MYKYILFSFLILGSIFNSYCQHPIIEVNESRREIRFINLKEKQNSPFNGLNRELSGLIINGIKNGAVKPIYISYKASAAYNILSLETFLDRLQIKSDPEFPDQELLASDMCILGLDQTIGTIDGKECAEVHFVHFYANETIPIHIDENRYCFSVSWDDFMKVLNQHKEYLYYRNSYGSWWKGDVFVTNQQYLEDLNFCCDLLTLPGNNPEFKAIYTVNNGVKYTREIFHGVPCQGLSMGILIHERSDNQIYSIDSIFIRRMSDWDPYRATDQFAFGWKDFQALVEKKGWQQHGKVYTLSDAFLLEKFTYSIHLNPQKISNNGLFYNGMQDSLCRNKLTHSFSLTSAPIEFDSFQLMLSEGVFLSDPLNRYLHQPGHDIVEMIYENVLNGKLTAYKNDSLTSILSVTEVHKNAEKIVDIPEFEFDRKYKKRALFSMNYKDTISGNYEIQYYQVKKKFRSVLDMPVFKLHKYIVPYSTPLYAPAQLDVLELVYRITFNSNGKNKKYDLKGIAIKVPADIDVRGVEIPIAYVRWEDVRPILMNDPCASIMYQGKKQNLIELLENRQFYSVFYKTGYIEPVE